MIGRFPKCVHPRFQPKPPAFELSCVGKKSKRNDIVTFQRGPLSVVRQFATVPSGRVPVSPIVIGSF